MVHLLDARCLALFTHEEVLEKEGKLFISVRWEEAGKRCFATQVLVHHYLDRYLHTCPTKLFEVPAEAQLL